MSVGGGEEKTPRLRRLFFLFLSGIVLAVDQLSKSLIQFLLESGESLPMIPSVFHLTLVLNQGVAFGLFPNSRTVLLLIITASILILTVLGFRAAPGRLKTQWAIGLILGGALGNWMDRIRLGAVVDFLDFRIWPVFNLADTAISIGVGLFLLEILFDKKKAPSDAS